MIEFLLSLTTAIVGLLRATLSFAAALVFSAFYTLPSGSYVVMGEIARQHEEYVVSAPTSTTITDVSIAAGDMVETGQTVIRFDDDGALQRAAALESDILSLEADITNILSALRNTGDLGGIASATKAIAPFEEDSCAERYAERLKGDGGLLTQATTEPEPAPPGAPEIPPLPETEPAVEGDDATGLGQTEPEDDCKTPTALEPFVFASEEEAVSFFRTTLNDAATDFSRADKRLMESRAAFIARQAFALREQTEKKRNELGLLNNEIEALQRFKAEGLLSDIQIDPLKGERDAVLLDISRIAAEYAALNSQMIDMQLRVIDSAKSENADNLTRRLDELIAERRALLDQLSAARDAASESAIASPISGKVEKIPTGLAGRQIKAGELLFTVAPAKTAVSFQGEHFLGLNVIQQIDDFCVTSINSIETNRELEMSHLLSRDNIQYDNRSIVPVQNASFRFELSDADLARLNIPAGINGALPARIVIKQCA
ncbi:MAG: hypothetical protein AAFW68_09355 [Pseudomonadota bacterium]